MNNKLFFRIMKTTVPVISLIIVTIISLTNNRLYSEESTNFPDSVIYPKRFNEIFIGYGPDLKNQENKLLLFSNVRSGKIMDFLYFSFDGDILASFKAEDRYFALAISPGISLMKYFGKDFRIYGSATFGLSFLDMKNKDKWSYFGYCAGARIGAGYWRISLEAALKYFAHKEVNISPLTIGLKFNTWGLLKD